MQKTIRVTMKVGHGRTSLSNERVDRWTIVGGKKVDHVTDRRKCVDSVAAILGTTDPEIRALVSTRPVGQKAPKSMTRTQVLILMMAIRKMQPSIDSAGVELLVRYIVFAPGARLLISRVVREYFRSNGAQSMRSKATLMHSLFTKASQLIRIGE